MKIEDILAKTNFEDVLKELKKSSKTASDVKKSIDVFKNKHDILTRLDKTINKGKATEKTVVVSKLAIPFQRKIVNSRVAFLFGDPVKYILNDESQDIYKSITDIFKQNKMQYFDRQLARTVMSETHAAELWYVVMDEVDKKTVKEVKTMLLSAGNGDLIYPHWDEFGGMDAFTRIYLGEDERGKPISQADIYTEKQIVKARKLDKGWDLKPEENLFGKIPVVYYEQEFPEWHYVQKIIDRVEMATSKHADVNDYYGDPIVMIEGKVDKPWDKDDPGKVLVFEGHPDSNGNMAYGKAEYLTWDELPQSRKMEYDNLKDIIYSMTSTPDLSFNNIKGIGNISGITIKYLFMDAMMEAQNKEEIFGEGLQRRVNVLKAIIGKAYDVKLGSQMDADITIKFGNPLPTDIMELVNSLSIATGGEAIMSQETATRLNPLVEDGQEEVDKMDAEPEPEKPKTMAEIVAAETGAVIVP